MSSWTLIATGYQMFQDVPRGYQRLPDVPTVHASLTGCTTVVVAVLAVVISYIHHSIKLPCRCLAVKVLTYTTQHEERPCSRVRQVVFSPRKSDMTTKVCHDSAWAINSDKLRKVQRTCPTNPPSIQSFRSHRILLLFQTSSCTDSIGK